MVKDGRDIYLYSLIDYQADIELARDIEDIYRRYAMETAAAKRYKRTVVFHWLERVETDDNVDLTPTLALHLVRGWIDRGFSRKVLNQWFMETGRTAARKSADHHRRDELINKYRNLVVSAMRKANTDMRRIKEKVK